MTSRFFFLVLVFLLLPFVAFAQEGTAIATETPTWVAPVLTVLGAIAGSAWLSPFVKSNKWWMKIVDALAGNWLAARNSRIANQ